MSLEHDKLSDENWAYIRSLGLRPDIRSKEEYLREVTAGIERGQNLLHFRPNEAWTPPGVREVHRQILATVYAPQSHVAGEFTTEQLILSGPGNESVLGAEPHEIGPRLEKLCKALRDSFRSATSEEKKVRAAVEFHARFKALQAFPDANGRTASVLLDRHLSIALNEHIRLNMNGYEYRSTMWPAVRDGNFDPLEQTVKDALQRIHLETNFRRPKWSAPEAAYASVITEDVRLPKDEILQLDEASVKRLVDNPEIAKLNGLTRRSLQQEFLDRGSNERAGAEDVKKLLLEALEQESRHSQVIRLRADQTLSTRVLKPNL